MRIALKPHLSGRLNLEELIRRVTEWMPMGHACFNKDDVRLSSSSGAVFSSLAEYVLNKNGIVYGVTMSEDCYSAEFIAVKNKKELTKLRGSKYLPTKIRKCRNRLAISKIRVTM